MSQHCLHSFIIKSKHRGGQGLLYQESADRDDRWWRKENRAIKTQRQKAESKDLSVLQGQYYGATVWFYIPQMGDCLTYNFPPLRTALRLSPSSWFRPSQLEMDFSSLKHCSSHRTGQCSGEWLRGNKQLSSSVSSATPTSFCHIFKSRCRTRGRTCIPGRDYSILRMTSYVCVFWHLGENSVSVAGMSLAAATPPARALTRSGWDTSTNLLSRKWTAFIS